jgi:WD40 repeat protein
MDPNAPTQFLGGGHRVLSASHDTTARIWDANTGGCLFELKGHEARLTAASACASGERAVTCSDDGTARVWDTSDGACVR